MAARSMKHRRAFKALALLPLPFSLTLFKGAPSAAAATGLPTIGAGTAAGTAAGVGAAGITTKIAIGLAAVAVASGAGYEGVKAVQEPTAPTRPAAKIAPAAATPIARRQPVVAANVTRRVVPAKPVVAKKPKREQPTQAATPERGKSAAAPGHNKPTTRATPKTTAKAGARRPEDRGCRRPEGESGEPTAAKGQGCCQGDGADEDVRVRKPKPAAMTTRETKPSQGMSADAPGQLSQASPAKPNPKPEPDG